MSELEPEAVLSLVKQIDQLRADLERVNKERDEWCRQCNFASEHQADTMSQLTDLLRTPAPATTLKPLALTEDRTPEQLEADGDNGVCWGCGEEDCACGAERAEQEGA